MKRSRRPVGEEGKDLGGKAARLVPIELVRRGKRRKAEHLPEFEDLDYGQSSRTDIPETNQAHSSGFINMSVIHGPGDVAPEHGDSSEIFPYELLDVEKLEIRVVILRPGIKSSPIECYLEHVSTKKEARKGKKARPSYKALSYTWGSPEIHKTIFLNGIEVQVRENLWQALYHLRLPDTELCLWIDAICINQDDILERNQQVSRMGTIYGMAKEVLVWLGPEEDDSKVALDFIEKTMSFGKGELQLDSFVDRLVSTTPAKRAVSKLVEREYWKRAWIIQEVFRARKITIHCGQSVLPWSFLAKFFRLLNQMYPLEGNVPPLQISILKSCLPANLTKHRTSQYHNLETLLETYKRSSCSDPRDRIYSLVGLAKNKLTRGHHARNRGDMKLTSPHNILDQGDGCISVDYSLSPLALFQSLALRLMFIREEEIEEPHTPGRLYNPGIRVRRLQLLQEVLALKSFRLGTMTLTKEDSIVVDCAAFDRDAVLSVGPSWCRNSDDPAEHQRVLKWHTRGDIGFRLGINDLQPIMDTFTEDDLARVRTFQQMNFDDTICRSIDTEPRKAYNKQPIPITPLAHDAASTGRSRECFFTTREGRLGIGSCNLDPEDIIYGFSKSDVAIAVRFTPTLAKTTATVMGRVLLLKTEREVAWEAGLPMAEFQYAVPTSKGTDHEITLPLAEWQSLTW